MSPVTTYHLEMLDRNDWRPKPPPAGFEMVRVEVPSPELNRNLYQRVGADWKWSGRLKWSAADWEKHVNRDTLHTFIGQLDGQPFAYVEMEEQAEHSIEFLYFGPLPEFIGKGLGGPFLSAAIERAWRLPGTRRVWLHTCTDDHPHALANYEKRGFRLFKTVVDEG